MTSEALLPDSLNDSNNSDKTLSSSDGDKPATTTPIKDDGKEIIDESGPSKVGDENDEKKLDPENDEKSKQLDGEPETDDAKVATDPSGDRIAGDKFVLLNPYSEYNKDERLRAGFFAQMEKVLKHQIDQCEHYKSYYEQQDNATMAQKFAAYEASSTKYLELLRTSFQNKETLPAFDWENVSFNCLPVNVDIREKEVQLVVKTSNLAVSNTEYVYLIAEFEFPLPKEEPIKNSFSRWLHHIRIDPKMICCSGSETRQLDIVYGTSSIVLPFDKPDSTYTGYTRALSFYVDKGKSRTLKRKFKPVKLTFYEKKYLRKDRKIGSAQVRIDQINDVSTSIVRVNLVDGRKELEAVADIRIRVREPLVDKSVRAHEERILHLT